MSQSMQIASLSEIRKFLWDPWQARGLWYEAPGDLAEFLTNIMEVQAVNIVTS